MPMRACLALLLSALVTPEVHTEVGDVWERAPDAPIGSRYRVTVGAFQGKLWATGGEGFDCDCTPLDEVCEEFCGTVYYDDLWSSPDGKNWTRVLEHAPFGNRWVSRSALPRFIEFNSYVYMMGGFGDTWRSSNGLDWERKGSPGNSNTQAVKFGDRLLILGTSYFSLDGVTWISKPDFVPPPFDMDNLYNMGAVEHNGQLYAFQPQHVWRSDDGYNWTELVGGNTGDLIGGGDYLPQTTMLSFANRIWMLGPSLASTRLNYSIDGASWTSSCQVNCPLSTIGIASTGNILFAYQPGANRLSVASCSEMLGGPSHSVDRSGCGSIDLSELLRVVQFYNFGGLRCDETSEDGYGAGLAEVVQGEGAIEGAADGEPAICLPHSSDYAPQDWRIAFNELLRLVQIYNAGAYHPCGVDEETSEDGFCLGQ